MDYTIENGRYYKVVDAKTKEIITIGELSNNAVLSTIHEVEFLTEEEFNALTEE